MPASIAPDAEAQMLPFVPSMHYHTMERKHSAVVERGQTLFPLLSAVGTFGASLALASFYAARQLEDDSVTLSLLSWAYAAYAVATVVTLVWQLALLSDIWVAARRTRFFRSERGVLLALGLSILSIAAGTILVSLALRQPSTTPSGVIVSAYTATGAIAIIILFTFLRFIFVWTTTEREKPFLILPLNHFYKPRDDAKAEKLEHIERFLSMYAQHGERLAGLDQLHSPQTSNEELAEMLYYAGLTFQYEVRNKPEIDDETKRKDITAMAAFIKNARQWKKALDMLNAFDKGHFYTRPLKEQAWRFQFLLETIHDPATNAAPTPTNSL